VDFSDKAEWVFSDTAEWVFLDRAEWVFSDKAEWVFLDSPRVDLHTLCSSRKVVAHTKALGQVRDRGGGL